jgi:hypothetical protein
MDESHAQTPAEWNESFGVVSVQTNIVMEIDFLFAPALSTFDTIEFAVDQRVRFAGIN